MKKTESNNLVKSSRRSESKPTNESKLKLSRKNLRHSETALVASKKLMQDMIDHSSAVMYAFDLEGRFLLINRQMEIALGTTRKKVLNKTRETIMPSEIAAEHRANDLKVIESRQPITVEEENEEPDGKHTYLSVKFPLFDSENGIYGVGGVSTDITERKRAEQRTLVQLQRLHTLHVIDQTITSNLDFRLTLDLLLENVISRLRVDAADVLLFEQLFQKLKFAAGYGFHTNSVEQTNLRLGESHAGQAALERRTVHIPNLNVWGKESERDLLLKNESFVTYIGVPLIAKGAVKGVLEIFHRTPLEPDPDWLNFLETLGGQAAIAIDDAQLFEKLQRSNDELALAYEVTIEGWSRAMDLRDKETEGHTQRVTEMAVRLAWAMGMSNEQIVHVRRGALLHDMGKLGVPDSILLKPGELTDEEWLFMRKHPQNAYDMFSSIEYLRPALDIPHYHHEKWDGTGYPQGLKGLQIPLPARVFAVVDVWDALQSDRPYRTGWTQEKVLEYIRAQSGIHFDPKVVELFMKVLSEKTHKYKQKAG